MEHTLSGRFDEDGFPCLDLLVLNKKEGRSERVKAIIDTGAAHCMIREDLARRLQLPELRIADYRHPVFGAMPIREYLMDLHFGGNGTNEGPVIEGVRAGTLVDLAYPASVILGVELLRHCSFEYNGRLQAFTLRLLPPTPPASDPAPAS